MESEKKKICPKCKHEDGSGLWVLLMEDFLTEVIQDTT